jgi:hypothetical protein
MTQASNLEIHEVADGYIVYQRERDRIHYLNKTAAVIFEFCDGRYPSHDVVELVARIYELDPSAHDEIRTALESLVQEGLVRSI